MRKIKKILLIDDDKINNFINKGILTKLNIAEEIVALTNGKLALDYIKENCFSNHKVCPHFIILDHLMPVMDGIDFMEELNNLKFKEKEQSKILLLASHATEEDIEVYNELGIDDYTPKPLSEEIVIELWKKYWKD
jgi:CheY-like chemotaxis protein